MGCILHISFDWSNALREQCKWPYTGPEALNENSGVEARMLNLCM